MVHKRRITFIMLVIFGSGLISGCEDGIRFPWSKDKPHEAEVTEDTTNAGVDSLAVNSEADSLDVAEDTVETDVPVKTKDDYQASGVKQWRVVVSSMPSRELADKFISRHKIPGANVAYVDKLNTYRVVYASFPELSDAQVEFGMIKSDFPDAWLVYF